MAGLEGASNAVPLTISQKTAPILHKSQLPEASVTSVTKKDTWREIARTPSSRNHAHASSAAKKATFPGSAQMRSSNPELLDLVSSAMRKAILQETAQTKTQVDLMTDPATSAARLAI